MRSESAIENRAVVPTGRGRRRKRGNGGSGEGPVFVDTSGRRARRLRRLGLLLGAVCLGYAVVLGMAFMGWGLSMNPSSLLPFGSGRAGPAPGGTGPRDGFAPTGAPGTGTPPAGAPSGAPAPSVSATAN
jgi:hypothetical protein